jgi:hypothetical protein
VLDFIIRKAQSLSEADATEPVKLGRAVSAGMKMSAKAQ